MRWLKFILPLIVCATIGIILYQGLGHDPRLLPSPLVGKPAPAFSLPTLGYPSASWSPQSMQGQVWLLNIWGSWCGACQIEHPLLLELARSKQIPIVGLAWKDLPEHSSTWLDRLGNPYLITISDRAGNVAIDYGVYGAPETFLIDQTGTIRYKHVGPLSADTVQNTLLPMARDLRQTSSE